MVLESLHLVCLLEIVRKMDLILVVRVAEDGDIRVIWTGTAVVTDVMTLGKPVTAIACPGITERAVVKILIVRVITAKAIPVHV